MVASTALDGLEGGAAALVDRGDALNGAGVPCPSLLVAGAKDPTMQASLAALAARPAILPARLITMVDAGHLPPLEAAGAFAAEIRAFLDLRE
jgi:pimeloyl-ACP methyl ester carboxylesterase